MPFNVKNAIEVPLEVFGSRISEMSPTNCPEGVSPDEQDNTFVPGEVRSRPCLQRVLTNAPANTTCTYLKSFVTPTGQIKNLYLFSNGQLFWEDPIGAPGIGNLLYTGPVGSYAKSATMFGREFIGINDTLHGATVPLQWDGTNLDRVTQDGPGAVPTVTSIALPSSPMDANPNTLTRNNNTVTGNTVNPHNLKIGYQVQISDVPDSNSTTVNQIMSAGTSVGSGDWQFVGNQYRTITEPVTTALADLVFSNFGFSIPGSATILGVVVSAVLVSQNPTTGVLSQVALWQTGAQLGTAKSPATPFTNTLTPQSYGTASDQWGTTLTPAIVNDPTFGFAMAVNTSDVVRLFIGEPFQVTVYYTLSGSGTVAIVSSIVINNETNPGLALVTTTEPHGLAPEEFVSIVGVAPGAVANIASAQWSSGTTTLTTSTEHHLTPGSLVQVAGVTTSTGTTAFSFDGTFVVATVPSPVELTYAQQPITAADPDVINATAATGAITLAWPIPDSLTPTYFQVESAPSATTFYIPISYADGTWTSGTVGFAWSGTFYVTAVPSATEFQYQQYGPNGSTTAVGTVTPYGQAAPGFHLMRLNFLTRQGAVLKSGPYVKFIANGGQYLQIDNLLIGPSNVVARILEFTGADGAYFFYLPIPANVNGQVVSTATQINDNTTTSILLDFSDNSLFGGLATSIPGNDLRTQIVLDGALGFGQYATRAITYGQRNRLQNFLNLSFDGGYLPLTPTFPAGWTPGINPGTLAANPILPPSSAWLITCSVSGTCGVLYQSAYEDGYGVPILTGNTKYKLRVWLKPSSVTTTLQFVASFFSVSTGFFSQVTLSGSQMSLSGSFVEGNFDLATPEEIPTDAVLTIYAADTTLGTTLLVDDISIIYQETPYLDGILFGSYGNNPEGISGLTGKFGPVTDTRKVMDFAVMRETFYMLTQEPSGRLHETVDNGTTEPSGWQVNEVGANCGALSAFSLTKSQADDTAASGGEEWMAWASLSGARIFGGSYPDKISQEIQPDWAKINPAAALTVWCVNDPVERALYFGVPLNSATAPSKILFMSYRQLDSAESIASSAPFRVSLSGKLVATDNSRKWSLWNMTMNAGALMYRVAGSLALTLGAGNSTTPGTGGFGNVYTLNPAKYTDDDYGQVNSYYTTYAFVNRGAEAALGLGSHQKQLAYLLASITWVGTLNITVYPNDLDNPWPLICERNVSQNNFDVEWGGAYARGSRFFFKVQAVPVEGQTDNQYSLTMLTAALMQSARLKVRGAAQ